MPVWMLYDIHAFISAAAGTAATGAVSAEDAKTSKGPRGKAKTSTAQKAGKYRV